VRGLQLSSNRHKRYRAAQKAHAAATVEDLQHRISELEIQLQQARETQRNFPERAHLEEKVSRLGEDLATKSNTLAKQFEILGALCNKDTFIPTLDAILRRQGEKGFESAP